jgi:hypothetical protein
VEDQWDYVEMWLKRNNKNAALFFWRQAEDFANASRDMPNTSSPLTRYYSAMNAAKALLSAKGIGFSPYHGLTGENRSGDATLADEEVTLVANNAIAPQLCRYMGEVVAKATYTLQDILYNLPYIHRAFTITVPAQPELFLPISSPSFVRIEGTTDSYFTCTIPDKYFQSPSMIAQLAGYEHDVGITDDFVVRRKKRFTWDDAFPEDINVDAFMDYYRCIRKTTFYIKGSGRLWYLKMSAPTAGLISRSSLSLTLMGLHKLSELARYTPDLLARHLDSQHNWLLSEFINLSLPQFIDEIAAELTGHEFMPPGYSARS